MGRTKKLGLALTREQPLLPGDPQGVEGPQGGGAEAVGEGRSGGARAGSTQGGGRAVWSSWQDILGSDAASDIGNLQALGDEGYQNEGEAREGGQEETDGAISQEEEEDEPEPIEIDMDVD